MADSRGGNIREEEIVGGEEGVAFHSKYCTDKRRIGRCLTN